MNFTNKENPIRSKRNKSRRTCHAAIVSREHGIPCIVGTGNATEALRDGQNVTISCSVGDEGFVYDGALPFVKEEINWSSLKRPKTHLMVNLGNPAQALKTRFDVRPPA